MKKILVIDDDVDIRDVVETIFAGNYEVKKAETASSGYKILENYSPDLIILDVMMEGLDSGFNMARDLKGNDQYKKIKILMLTSIDTEMKINFKAEAGDPDWLPVDDYIEKPIDPKVLTERAAKLLS